MPTTATEPGADREPGPDAPVTKPYRPADALSRRLPMLLFAALLLGLAAIGLLRRFEYRIPQWLAETPPKADAVLVVKSELRLYLLRDGKPYRGWRVALGGNPIGHKEREGDRRTPEGNYSLD